MARFSHIEAWWYTKRNRHLNIIKLKQILIIKFFQLNSSIRNSMRCQVNLKYIFGIQILFNWKKILYILTRTPAILSQFLWKKDRKYVYLYFPKNRRAEIILCRLRINHTRLIRGHLMEGRRVTNYPRLAQCFSKQWVLIQSLIPQSKQFMTK